MFSFLSPQVIANLWLVTGAILVVLELFTAPGVGFLFGGMGALTAGVAITLGWVGPGDYLMQLGWFAGSSCVWTLVLWKPLKMLRASSQNPDGYNDMIGSVAIVYGDDLVPGRSGKVAWSGTILHARLSDDFDVERIAVGEEVTIGRVEGSTAIVRPA